MRTRVEAQRAYSVAYYATHREKYKAQCAAYYATHCEQIKAQVAAYYTAHQTTYCEKDKIRGAAYRATHREQISVRGAAYRVAHPEIHQLATARRRARKFALSATLTTEEWEIIKQAYKHRCAYCGERPRQLTQDHVIPITRGGGTTSNNIVPACKSCNSSKGTKLPSTPVRLVLI